jgi:hypothetical protein
MHTALLTARLMHSVLIGKIVLLDFVSRPNYKIIKLQPFGKLSLLPHSDNKWSEEDRKSVSFAPWLS